MWTPTPDTAGMAPTRSRPPRSSAGSARSICRWKRFTPSSPPQTWPLVTSSSPVTSAASRRPWRVLSEPPAGATPVAIEHRRIPATPAAAVSEVIDAKEASAWYQGALGELHALLAAHKITPAGPAGGIYANDLFSYERGQI